MKRVGYWWKNSLSLGVNLDRLDPNDVSYRLCGISFFAALFGAKETNWSGQSIAVLKCIIKETPSILKMTSPDIAIESTLYDQLLYATLFLIEEGAYTAVYDILTAKLNTIDIL